MLTYSPSLFHRPHHSGKTANVDSEISQDDYQRAEKAIFHAVEQMEQRVQHAIEKEVDTLFPELEHHEKESIKEKAKAKVQTGAKKVREKMEMHDHATKKTLPDMYDQHPFPYAWPKEDPEHRILHAVEAAEKAVLHAVEEEVNTIFHEMKHEDNDKSAKGMKKAVKQSMEKMDKHVDEKHEHRRKKVQEDKWSMEDYLRFEMESME
jgi:putative NIF3 family GTP cyclohydrolase 1 type 2